MTVRSAGRLYTVAEAAKRLSITDRRVRSLIQSGELQAVHAAPRIALITEESLIRLALREKRAGRPYSSETAMGALYLLSGESIDWLSVRRRYEIRRLLKETDADAFVRNIRHRADVHEYWANALFLDRLSGSGDICRSGGCEGMAEYFELSPSELVEGYVEENDLPMLKSRYMLKELAEPKKVRFHVVRGCPIRGRRVMPVAVCAADLADSIDPRERNAGMGRLAALLRDFQGGTS